MERWHPAGPWAGLHFAAEKAANGTTATQISVPAAAGVYLRPVFVKGRPGGQS